MKKRNMAITIAAVSAATSVAPALAFADTLDNQVIASTDANAVNQLKGEIQGFLNTKYTDNEDMLNTPSNAGQSVYTIQYQVGKSGQVKNITNMEDLTIALASLDKDNTFLNIQVTNKGYDTVNGQVVDYQEEQYKQADIDSLYTTISNDIANTTVKDTQGVTSAKAAVTAAKTAIDKTSVEAAKTAIAAANTALAQSTVTFANVDTAKEQLAAAQKALASQSGVDDASKALEAAINAVDAIKANSEGNITDITKVDANTVSLELLNNNTPLVIKTGDAKLNLTSGAEYKKDTSGNYLGLNDKDQEVVLTGANDSNIATNPERIVTGFATDKSVAPENKDKVMNFGVDYKGIITKEYKASDLYDFNIGRFTIDGNQLDKFIEEYNAVKDKGGQATQPATVTLNAEKTTLTVTFPEDKTDEMNGQTLMPAAQSISGPAEGQYADIVITGSSKELTQLQGILNQTANPTVGELAGMDRYDTAVQVSKATFADQTAKTGDKAGSVVLVSGTALADGLAATPYARAEKAPVLLTANDKVSDKTMDEIKRVLGNSGTIHVIGGENTISKAVETQLKAKGYTIDRIKGNDRYETSLEVAKKMESTLGDEVYVAGGYAEADTMSIAGVAAREGMTNPILLVNPKTGLSNDQISYLEGNTSAKSYIIGGENSVPAVTATQIKDEAKLAKPERLAGADRQGTNAAVIKEFYTTPISKLYVAKSDNQGLVDSLSAGALAGKDKAPVVLATNAVNESQQSVLKAIGMNNNATKTQVGYGIAAQVWSTITDLFTK